MADQGKDASSKKERKSVKREVDRLTAQVARYSAMSQHPSCSPTDKSCYRMKMRDAKAALRVATRAQRLM